VLEPHDPRAPALREREKDLLARHQQERAAFAPADQVTFSRGFALIVAPITRDR
jgi:hypothetical protein